MILVLRDAVKTTDENYDDDDENAGMCKFS